MSGTKNLGQVAGLFIGTSAPSNTTLIWFDSTPAIQCHKVYNKALGQWVVLDNSVISPITYSEIVTLSTGNGLTIGQWFKITDRNGVLALAITTTKIQYTDTLSNIVIDDLGHNKSYIVSSSNLLIDDLSGVWDSVNNKLLFSFDEATPSMNDNYYILGKGKINNVWKFVKFKITKLLSTEGGNSISWLNGFYLNFTEKLRTYYNNPGGIVSKDSYDNDQTNVQNQINNVANNIQNVVQQADENILEATTDTKIYGKRLPSSPVSGAPADVIQGDTLLSIVNKSQRWFNYLRWATGVRLSTSYVKNPNPNLHPNNNDSVETAIGKIDSYVSDLTNNAVLPNNWSAKPLSSAISDVSSGNSISEAFSRLVGRLNQLGKITANKLISNITSNNNPILELNLNSPSITLRRLTKSIKLWLNSDGTGGLWITANGSGGETSITSNIYHNATEPQSDMWETFNSKRFAPDSLISTSESANRPEEVSASLFLKNKRGGGKDFDLLCNKAAIGALSLGFTKKDYSSGELIPNDVFFLNVGAKKPKLPANENCIPGKMFFITSYITSGGSEQASSFSANNNQVIRTPIFRWSYNTVDGTTYLQRVFNKFDYTLSGLILKGRLNVLVYTGETWSGTINETSYSNLMVWDYYTLEGAEMSSYVLHT